VNALFIDTGALVARVLPRDQYNRPSRKGWDTLENINVELISTVHVFDEAVSLLRRHSTADYAARWGRDHLASQEIEWLEADKQDLHESLRWLEKFSDQKPSFTDCVSFTIMRREGLQTVFGFDRHFEFAGFELWPQF
jgi:predicted nucleic acid-binding protein